MVLTDGIMESAILSVDTARNYVLPGEVLLIMDPDYFSAPYETHYAIPKTAVVSKVEHSSICGGLTETDGFALLYGEEKRLCALFSTSHNSDDTLVGKLYYENSACKDGETTAVHLTSVALMHYVSAPPTPGKYNYCDKGLFIEKYLSVQQDSAVLSLSVHFWGEGVGRLSLENRDSILWKTVLAQNDSFQTTVSFIVGLGEYLLFYEHNRDTVVDTLNLSALFPEMGALAVSEVAPRSDIEWLELYNSGSRTIHLEGYRLVRGDDTVMIPEGRIEPSSYALLSSYTDFMPEDAYIRLPSRFTLNNYTDTIVLASSHQSLDTLMWDHRNYSHWESETVNRINDELILCEPSPGTASSCRDGKSLLLSIEPNIVTPNGDGVDDLLHIAFGRSFGVQYAVSIFDLRGTLLYAQTAMKPDTLTWDGVDRYGRSAPRGPIFIVLESEGSVVRKEAVLWP